MKTKNLLLMAALAGTVFTGCSNDEELTPNAPDLTDTPILVNAGVNNLVATRAGYAAGELKEGSFGLYLTTEGTNISESRYNCENKKVSRNTNDLGWNYEDGLLYWKSNNASVNYYAYMPYQENVPTQLSVSVVQTETTFKDEDFLYAESKTATATTDGIGITFDHKLCKLNVKLSRGTELETGVTFSSVKLDACCALQADFNMSDGKVTPASAGVESITLLGNNDMYECIVVPQTFASTLAVTIEGSNGAVYKYKSDETLVFNSGKEYTLNLTVGRDRVEIGTITAAPWGTEEIGGDLETE